jgi:ATP-dependent Clp protease ATP-binding subunit ClpX
MKRVHAYCSFCRKSYREVGPLVEGPDAVYICAACIALCQSIVKQERGRRRVSDPISPGLILQRLDQLVSGQEEAKRALAQAADIGRDAGHVLLIGPSPGARTFLARALAHALDVPFATGDASSIIKEKHGSEEIVPVLFHLLKASRFDIAAAQGGVVYVDGVDRPDVQEALLRLWRGDVVQPLGSLQFDVRRVRFVCGGTFTAVVDGTVDARFNSQRTITAYDLKAAAADPEWVSQFVAIARVLPLDEEMLCRMAFWIDFDRAEGEPSEL